MAGEPCGRRQTESLTQRPRHESSMINRRGPLCKPTAGVQAGGGNRSLCPEADPQRGGSAEAVRDNVF
jgi:hypothetical protein